MTPRTAIMSRSEEARWTYDGKKVVIIGGSNSACEIAAELASICAQVQAYLYVFFVSSCIQLR